MREVQVWSRKLAIWHHSRPSVPVLPSMGVPPGSPCRLPLFRLCPLGQITIKADSNPIFIIQYTGNNAIEIREIRHRQNDYPFPSIRPST